MLGTRWLAGFLFAGSAFAQAPSVDEVLAWLPPDTETVIATSVPFRISGDDIGFLGDYLLSPLLPVLGDERVDEWRAATVRRAIVGARRFQRPPGIGLAPFEGCGYYVFESPVDIHGLRTEEIEGQTLAIRSGGLWAAPMGRSPDYRDYFATWLSPAELLACSDRSYLISVLERRRSGTERAALPASLNEWNHVDRSALLWGIRHYSADPGGDPTHPRHRGSEFPGNDSTGLTFQITDHPRARILGSSANQWKQMAEEDSEFEGQARFTSAGPGVWQVEVPADAPDAGNFAIFVFMAALGFAAHQ